MNALITDNYSRLKPGLFYLPLLLLGTIALYLYGNNALNVNSYIQIQKQYFYYLNSALARYPDIQHNLTQMGDALISLSLLSVFIVFAPAIWEALISVSLISLFVSSTLKNIFAIPRPAAAFDSQSFIIIGQKLTSHNSLPSGHSITVFTIVTVILFAFMPTKLPYRFLWIFFMIGSGLLIALTRVGVGAHYPLDVIVGSLVGYLSGLAGIFFNRKYKIWSWVENKKYYPVFILLLLTCSIFLVGKTLQEQLPIFFLTLAALSFSLYKITDAYFKR